MGNNQSEFEEKFYQIYSFVSIVQDKQFGRIKVYRRNIRNFDYIMIMEGELHNLDEDKISLMDQQLQLIRNQQMSNMLKLFHYRIFRQNKAQCQIPLLRVYVQYFNKTLHDYLSELRVKKIILSLDEAIYIIESVVNSLIAFRKMHIHNFQIKPTDILLSMEGQIYLSPLHYIQKQFFLKGSSTKYIPTYTQDKTISQHSFFPQKQPLLNLFLQITQYMSRLHEPRVFYELIEQSVSLQHIKQKIPYNEMGSLMMQQNIYNQTLNQGQNYV